MGKGSFRGLHGESNTEACLQHVHEIPIFDVRDHTRYK